MLHLVRIASSSRAQPRAHLLEWHRRSPAPDAGAPPLFCRRRERRGRPVKPDWWAQRDPSSVAGGPRRVDKWRRDPLESPSRRGKRTPRIRLRRCQFPTRLSGWARPSGTARLNHALGAPLLFSFSFSSRFQIFPQCSFQIQI